MHPHDALVVRPAVHPDPTVARFGFDLDHPYLERCWTPVLGPAAVTVLRRMSTLCHEHDTARTSITELAGEIGVKPATMRRTLHRIEQFGLISPPDHSGVRDVYATIAPLTNRQLAQVPPTVRAAHHRLLSDHLGAVTDPSTDALTRRLDHLQTRPATPGLRR